ncbi:MAG: TonB family protein [Terriglobales bacterium]
MPQNARVSLETVSGAVGYDVAASNHADNPDEGLILSTLKNLVAAGEHRLDPMLAAVADAAERLTGASGVALAMWRDGEMVCRARSGETAPALDSRLSSEAGISGECLRTGKSQICVDTEDNPLVDVEVCRVLGVRSIAVMPIQAKRRIDGILEVFSTEPAAFSEHHVGVLEQLAALAERAHTLEASDSSPMPVPVPVMVKRPPDEIDAQELSPEYDDVDKVSLGLMSGLAGRRPLVLGALGLAAILLLGFVIWLGWRGQGAKGGGAQVASSLPSPSSSPVVAQSSSETGGHVSGQPVADPRLWEGNSALKPNPGGGMLLASGSAPASGALVKANSKVGGTEGKKTEAERSLPEHAPRTSTSADKNGSRALHGEEAVPVAAPPVAGGPITSMPNPSALQGILSAKIVLPGLSPTMSQGVSGGRLMYRVSPVYPAQAKMFRLEGKVILNATVMEDGSVRDLKVVQGEAVLVRSAVVAVKQWRYQPFLLDGKPVKTETSISIDFKLPPQSH